ncbi:serine/threonine protein kinase [Polytolypa hystricis UAMH7299]|uniref:Serine/threonine protein kinase n=1 Tax=Polytolypa hystricis (strain UAMH7299) TaxID=1447883 RepID=A0A2B7Z1K2_POLH7|nr:serine/threonine protein kinase [Polytolypa hystricis UAMH7299]
MATFRYQSAFKSSSTGASDSTGPGIPTPESSSSLIQEKGTDQGSLASLICHASYLENELRADDSIFFDENNEVKALSRRMIGSGASFLVERAEWKTGVRTQLVSVPEKVMKWGKYIAIKSVRESNSRGRTNWNSVSLEIRALLHKYLRYHPNIVRLLGLGWGSPTEMGSIYPMLFLEYAEFGSMHHLQTTAPPLPFAVKQKLCYDIARGLAVLHACGIAHGDLKHENILIFRNRYSTVKDQPYTAKLADFGGAVMDLAHHDLTSLQMGTYPYQAPEFLQRLSADGIKKTDIYSFGMLVWRTFIDGKELAAELGVSLVYSEEAQKALQVGQIQNEPLIKAIDSVQTYAAAHNISPASIALVLYVLAQTIPADPKSRDLPCAQAALSGVKHDEIDAFMQQVALKNTQHDDNERDGPPGQHGISVDSLGFMVGSMGDDYDAQNNIPGYRPQLPHPEIGEFVFSPSQLKEILDWTQQQRLVSEFERAAQLTHNGNTIELQPWKAAYYLFQCYLTEFGVIFDPEKVCYWLLQASKADDEADVDYWARAWIWRICEAVQVPVPLTLDELENYLKWGLIRGHRNCMEDGKAIVERLTSTDDQDRWSKSLNQAEQILKTMTGGVGMPHYVPRKLRRDYDLGDLSQLANQIKEELGPGYESCLKPAPQRSWLKWLSADKTAEKDGEKEYRFNKIFVNHKGHGLLHYAATMGNLKALQFMVETYLCKIDIPNQSVSESPLVCACRSGHFDCAMYLLDSGASANGTELGEEAPLHWLCSFSAEQMAVLAKRLVDAGADIEKASGIMRKDVRMIDADWEDNFGIAVSPLGRAVLMKNLPAVKVLLELGANPLANASPKNSSNRRTAIELAAALTLPHILEVLLLYVDQTQKPKPLIFDETGMLRAAHGKMITSYDSTTLQSRLVRCGPDYKKAMFQTLQILHSRYRKLQDWRNVDTARPVEGMHLCWEIRLGNVDIVEALLELGHDPNGSPGHRPIEEAVLRNHSAIFKLLVNHDARLTTKRAIGNGMQFSLLQLLANRPRSSRSGIFIAEYLIRSGLAIEPLPDGSPSSLVLAIKNRYFDLADLLLEKGANINAVYQTGAGEEWGTVLGDLLRAHTEASLESISYVLRKHEMNVPVPAPISSHSGGSNPAGYLNVDFTVNKTNKLSALHTLALCPPEAITDRPQTSARIINCTLRAFRSIEQINHAHPTFGSALCIACVAGNDEAVTAFLEHGADMTVKARFDALAKLQTSFGLASELPETHEECPPLSLALAAFEAELSRLENDTQLAVHGMWKLKHLETIIELLRAAGAPVSSGHDAAEVYTELETRKRQLEDQVKLNSSFARVNIDDNASSEPVDLSIMTEEKPTGWKEGDEMNNEMAVRTFLTFMRGRNGGTVVR